MHWYGTPSSMDDDATELPTLEVSYEPERESTPFISLFEAYDRELQYNNPSIVKTGIVTANTLNIRSKPSTEWGVTILTTVSKGEAVTILGEYSRWYKIKFEGFEGWVHKQYLDPSISFIDQQQIIHMDFETPNILRIVSGSNLLLSLINHVNGKYSIEFTGTQIPDSVFDLNHIDVPLFVGHGNILDIYTKGWVQASLVKQSDTEFFLHFNPSVVEVKRETTANRELIRFYTSGRPNYHFETEDRSIVLTFSSDVAMSLPSFVVTESPFIQNLYLEQRKIKIDSIIPVNWKVFADSNSITIDMSRRGLTGKRIMIDPGHGGTEVGTYGRVSGVLEKDFNLQFSLVLKEVLESANAIVYLSRHDDTTVYQGPNYETFFDLMERIKLTERKEADLFISIHADNFPADLSINGTAAFYYSSLPHSNQSEKIGALIGSKVSQAIDTRWLGVQDSNFVVVRYNPFPSVLLELGFLSNKNDEAKLIDPIQQRIMAEAIKEALIEYYQ